MSSGRRPSQNVDLGVGCITLFLLPFAAVGVYTAVLAVQRAEARNWSETFFFTLFAVIFGGVGVGGIVAALAGRRKLKAQAVLEATHPESPWLWRADWASGRIMDSGRTGVITAWLLAAFWNLISWPAAFLAVRAAVQQAKPGALLALLFPLIGIGLLVWATRTSLRYRKYGASRLELSTVPGVVGRSLIGMVRAPASIHPDTGFQVTLTCFRRVTSGGGKHRSTSESILWQEERRVEGQPFRAPARVETHIPVTFRLPHDVPATDDSDAGNRIVWRLQLSAGVAGVDYLSAFDVPVFRTTASDQPLTLEEERLTQNSADTRNYEQPADSRILVTSTRRGTEILFPAARNPGAAVSLTLFLLLWVGCIWLQVYFHAPLVFPIITGLLGVLIFLGVLDLWFQVSRVVVDGEAVSWAVGYIVPGRERTISRSEVADVIATIGMRAGTTVYYDVVVVPKHGRKFKVGHSVRDKREAEWLAETMKKAIG